MLGLVSDMCIEWLAQKLLRRLSFSSVFMMFLGIINVIKRDDFYWHLAEYKKQGYQTNINKCL